jgi:hypothetical protein
MVLNPDLAENRGVGAHTSFVHPWSIAPMPGDPPPDARNNLRPAAGGVAESSLWLG